MLLRCIDGERLVAGLLQFDESNCRHGPKLSSMFASAPLIVECSEFELLVLGQVVISVFFV